MKRCGHCNADDSSVTNWPEHQERHREEFRSRDTVFELTIEEFQQVMRIQKLEADVVEAAIKYREAGLSVVGFYDYRSGYLEIKGPQADLNEKLLDAVDRLMRERDTDAKSQI